MPDFLKGDVWAAIASCASARAGSRNWREIRRRHLQRAMEGSWTSANRSRARPNWPNCRTGTFELTEEQDDGTRFYNVKITISDRRIHRRSARQPRPGRGARSTPRRDGVMVCAQMIFKSLTDPYSPCNEGSFRPIKLLTREGSSSTRRNPPIGFYFEIEVRVYDLIWRCLAQHIPERLAAGHFASICGTFIGGIHPDTGRQYTIIEPQIGGWGGAPGATAIRHLLRLPRRDLQLPGRDLEARNGVFVDRMELNTAPGGEGQWTRRARHRDGLPHPAENSFLTAGYTRSRILPWALEGGLEGSPNYVEVPAPTANGGATPSSRASL
jgi:N-methylhydantoinase B